MAFYSVFTLVLLALCTAAAPINSTSISHSRNTPIPYRPLNPPLSTPWTEKVGTSPWPQHPRPQLSRETWKSLNGIWTYQSASGAAELSSPPAGLLAQEVLIPSCIESGLSGVMESDVMYMWFATTFDVSPEWAFGQPTILLNFEAVDYEATVFINGYKVGFHRGGYFRFTVDITDHVKVGAQNDLRVFVYDPTDEPPTYIPHGKQTRYTSHIWYTPCSGIWQSVWLEAVPTNYISGLEVTPLPVQISLVDEGDVVLGVFRATTKKKFSFHVPSAKLWSPETPKLYKIVVNTDTDAVESYTGFRTISSRMVKGVQRPVLNGKFVFQFGTLDQGYWPDGIYVPPTVEAMEYDLKLLKSLGMNMVRKHIKVEPHLFYHACDRLGLLVIQDMPSMHPAPSVLSSPPNPDQQAEFERQVELLVSQFKGYPCIVTWVIYNEGWGQLTDPYYPEIGITARIRELDPTRLVDATTGWWDHGAGDFSDNHHYADPQCGTPWYSLNSAPYDPARIGFQGEFGGVGHRPETENLWPLQQAIDSIPQTYELNADVAAFNYRAHVLLAQLRDQVALYGCSGAVWTQTTDVEGEVNGLVTYDRRVVRANATQWREDIRGLYSAAQARG
ncbi:family 2 glycoside hydrolase [Cercophora scortea]|uniref:Family 2 glycoside hydrolase n=1 Tax=Cercophora scortea TaxID=314031 RepID=A0AAE0J3L1_9PEZI|nr:family 2 glycoside hydrolase [Cercophora scortea]